MRMKMMCTMQNASIAISTSVLIAWMFEIAKYAGIHPASHVTRVPAVQVKHVAMFVSAISAEVAESWHPVMAVSD